MANELEFKINKRSIRGVDTTTGEEYFSTFIDQFKWKRDVDDNFTFYNSTQTVNAYGDENLNRLGVNQDAISGLQDGVGSFLYSTTLNPDTGVVFVSADLMATWLGTNTGIAPPLEVKIISNDTLTERIIVQQNNVVSTLGGVIDSTKEYFLDGVINLTGLSMNIEIPIGGINIKGYDFNTSGLTCSDTSYTLFTSPIGGSGDVLFSDFLLDISGVGSKVYDIVDSSGLHAVETARVNYNNCTSRGVIDHYRQGLETGTGYFGGTPELTLDGVWVGGYFIDTSIVRFIDAGSYSLFKAGATFSMASRFRSNQNIDLNTSVSFFDFIPANFPNPSTLQMDGCLISRNGVFDSSDVLLTPNIDQTDLASKWVGNTGLSNTHVGGLATVTTEVATVIAVTGTFVTLLGTFTATELEHFDSPVNGQLRHLGNTPREYRIIADFNLDSTANDDVTIKVRKWDDSASSFSDIFTQSRQINNFSGGRDVGFFNFHTSITLDADDYVFLEVTNQTGTNNVTAENGSTFEIVER